MTKPIRVLLIEDSPDDAWMIQRELRRAGFNPRCQRVSTEEAFLQSLDAEFDIILADYTLPQFDGLRALELLKQQGREIPFIIVSGTIGEERAVAAIKEGAADYLLKDRLARLGPAVNHALEQRRMLQERKRDQENLRAKHEAERANAAKTEFLSRMSHELRTPLNAILGFGQILELDTLNESQTASVSHILRAGRHLLHLINEVLDISSIESGNTEMHCEEVDVQALVKETFTLIRPMAAHRSVELQLADIREPRGLATGGKGPYVTADRRRLRQVLLNLFSNAVKYNVLGGCVMVDCQLTFDRLRLRVADTGPGISAENAPRLFTPFDRLDAEERGIQGTGLGLALSKRLMEAMGGDLGFQSGAGLATPENGLPTGAVFWIELPWVKYPTGAVDEPKDEPDISGRELAANLRACFSS